MENPLFTDPIAWFDAWYQEAKDAGVTDPNAMTLATANAQGQPSARVVLLKSHDVDGFVYYSNMESQKGVDVLENPHASLSFYFRDQARQIRIEGTTELVSDAEADAYFASRPHLSRVGAWASQQSRPLESREALMQKVMELQAKYPDGTDIPRPSHWTGVRVVPQRFEFWQAGNFRLHDRFVFQKNDANWQIVRLNP